MRAAGIATATGRCLACGAALRYSGDRRIAANTYYCSMACMRRVPPLLARAMASTGHSDPRECVLDALRSTGTMAAAADVLQVDRWTLLGWTKRLRIRRVVEWR